MFSSRQCVLGMLHAVTMPTHLPTLILFPPSPITHTLLQGYLLGVVLKPDLPACQALVDIVGGVMISDEVDRLLVQRGIVAGTTSPSPSG